MWSIRQKHKTLVGDSYYPPMIPVCRFDGMHGFLYINSSFHFMANVVEISTAVLPYKILLQSGDFVMYFLLLGAVHIVRMQENSQNLLPLHLVRREQ